jgi:hypothetical protein
MHSSNISDENGKPTYQSLLHLCRLIALNKIDKLLVDVERAGKTRFAVTVSGEAIKQIIQIA